MEVSSSSEQSNVLSITRRYVDLEFASGNNVSPAPLATAFSSSNICCRVLSVGTVILVDLNIEGIH
eukprot:snap_masked-scaffold_6-processed-gene-18.0-mRNA-1 protein AED:1.00 eAED:1.00 QI:0/0/0/0/1/1/2/0/65